MFKHLGRLLASIMVTAMLSAGAAAQTFNESGDAGQTLATAQDVPGGTTTILGSTQVGGDVDLYRFTLDTPGNITIRAWGNDQPTDRPDANLILFNGNGLPLWGDDDGYDPPMNWGSEIALNLPAGTYYLAFGGNNMYAYDANNNYICGNDEGDCSSATEPVATLVSNATADDEIGPYTITFSRATSGGGGQLSRLGGGRSRPDGSCTAAAAGPAGPGGFSHPAPPRIRPGDCPHGNRPRAGFFLPETRP